MQYCSASPQGVRLADDLQKRDFAQTLARGLSCLEVLAVLNEPAGCTQIATAMGVSRAAARRILLTLEHLGYVIENRGFYAASPKVLSLGRGLLAKNSLWSAVVPEVVGIADRFNEPCSISVLDALDIVFVCRDSTRRIFTSRLEAGDRLPAHCSASGKILLAALPAEELEKRLSGVTLPKRGTASITDHARLKEALDAARSKHFALAVDEMEDGTISVAVPLSERDGRTVAAMSFASHRTRSSIESLTTDVLPALRKAADRVERIIADYQDRSWVIFSETPA